MAVEIADAGTQLAVISTVHTVSSQTDLRTYVFAVDLVNLAAGDTLELVINSRVRAAGAVQQTYSARYGPVVQENLTVLSVPIPNTHEVSFTLEQTAGVGRNFDWEIRALD